MVPPSEVPGDYLRRLQQADPGESVFSVYLGVDMPTEEIPTQGCGHILHMPTYDTLDVAEIHSNPDFYSRALMMLMVPTLHDRALAPKGKSVVILQCAASMRSLDQWGTNNGRRTKKYKAHKKEIASQLIRNAEQIIPGLSKRIEVQIESTPFTLHRHTLNSAGASVGWTAHPRETFRGGLKGLFGASNTPIPNLYQVGHWTMSPGGAPAGLMTGKIVSTVLRQTGCGGASRKTMKETDFLGGLRLVKNGSSTTCFQQRISLLKGSFALPCCSGRIGPLDFGE